MLNCVIGLLSVLYSTYVVRYIECANVNKHTMVIFNSFMLCYNLIVIRLEQLHYCRAQWLRGRASDSRLRGPGFESCAAVLKPWAIFFTLHCSSSLSCIYEYLAIASGGYVYEQPSRINL